MLKNIALVGGVASVMALAMTMPSQAATVVTSWGYTVNAGFFNYTSTAGGHTGITASNTNNSFSPGLPTFLSWGDSGPFSTLSLGANNGSSTGTVFTNLAAVPTSTVTADNHPITGPTLATATIHDTLQLQSLTPPPVGSPFNLPQLSFDIAYDETPNSGLASDCAAQPSTTPCADILAITNLTNAGFDTTSIPGTVFISQTLPNYGGEDYTINLFITGLVHLTANECNAVNTADSLNIPLASCFGFISQESNTNNFQASLQILDKGPTQVPEPATIALFGSGLFGLGGLIKRRRKAKSA